MSLKEWKEKYYPITAEEIANTKGVGPIKLIQHSLQKWKGLRLQEMGKYDLLATEKFIHCHGTLKNLSISNISCSLCQKYLSIIPPCNKCPIYKTNKRECFVEFDLWIKERDPEPMIKLLEQTLEFYKGKNRERQAKNLSRKNRP